MNYLPGRKAYRNSKQQKLSEKSAVVQRSYTTKQDS